MGYAQFFGCRSAGHFAPAPCGHDGFVVLAPILCFPPEVYAFGFGGGDPFGLPLAVKFPLCLCHIAQKLEYDVSNQYSGEIPTLAGVQQGHIQYNDSHLLLFGQYPSLL